MAAKPIPDGYHSVTPNLVVENAAKVIEFTTRAFGAQLRHRMEDPDGTIMHAEVKIGDSIVMMCDARGSCQPTPTSLFLYVADVDAVFKRALRGRRHVDHGARGSVLGGPHGRRCEIPPATSG